MTPPGAPPHISTASGIDPDRLRHDTIASGAAAVIARTLQALLFLGAAVILARLLTPEDFGVFAMIAPLGFIAGNVANQCVQTALLQGEDTPEGTGGFFRLIVRANIAIAVALVVGGLLLSRVYGEPRVIALAAAWAALLLLLVPATFQEAQLKRGLRFPAVMTVQISTLALGVAASLVAAGLGAGYWALAIQVFVMEAGRAVGIFILSDWRPPRAPRGRSEPVDRLWRAWIHLAGLRISTMLADVPGVVAVGWAEGATRLGHYDVARRWTDYPFGEPFAALTDVSIASVARVRGDAARFRWLIGRAVLVMLTISLPVLAFVGSEAETVVLLVLGSQWVDAVWFVSVLSVAAGAMSLVRVNRWVLLAGGATKRLLTWSLFIETPVVASMALLGLPWGAEGVAIATAVGAVGLVVPAAAYAARGSALSVGDLFRPVSRPVFASLSGAATLALAGGLLPPAGGWGRLFGAAALHGVAFLAVWHAIPGGWSDTRTLWVAFRSLSRGRSARRAG